MSKPWKKHEPGSLLTTTRELLKASEMTQLEIYAATGIAPAWQTRFKAGNIPDPGVNRVERLFDLLVNEHENYRHRSVKQMIDRYQPLISKSAGS